MLYAVHHLGKIMIRAGCQWLTLAEFKGRVTVTKASDDPHRLYYEAMYPLLDWFAAQNDLTEEE